MLLISTYYTPTPQRVKNFSKSFSFSIFHHLHIDVDIIWTFGTRIILCFCCCSFGTLVYLDFNAFNTSFILASLSSGFTDLVSPPWARSAGSLCSWGKKTALWEGSLWFMSSVIPGPFLLGPHSLMLSFQLRPQQLSTNVRVVHFICWFLSMVGVRQSAHHPCDFTRVGEESKSRGRVRWPVLVAIFSKIRKFKHILCSS